MSRPVAVGVAVGALVVALGVTLGVTASAPSYAEPAAPESASAAPVCDERVLDEPAWAGSTAASRAGLRRTDDPTRWFDTCGDVYYREPVRVGPQTLPTARRESAVPAARDVLALSSRPSSRRTIYLDFTGHRTQGTAWNRDFRVRSFTSPPYQVDGDASTAFTAREQEQIRRAWESVAEDYAPFDVDVTTKDPGNAALVRSSRTDRTFGTRVVITAGGPLYDQCACGGIAYLGTFDLAGRQSASHQPSFVFTRGTTTDGWDLAESAAHEAGHTLGLAHDGRGRDEYFFGSARWAPIMGAGYDKLSQFSRGEYDRATNRQDDLAIMARHGIDRRADDHAATRAGATPLRGAAARRAGAGVIATSGDRDAFSFTADADGPATLAVDPTGSATNLDVRMTLLDGSGAVVARVDPAPSGEGSRPSPAWLRARWTGDLVGGQRYVVVVDGVGHGDPRAEGWSDYGSLGAYRVSVAAD